MDHPNFVDVGISNTESIGGTSNASAFEEVPNVIEPNFGLG